MTTMTRSAAVSQSMQGMSERTRRLITQLNLYYATVSVLGLVCFYLLVHLFFTWRAATNQDATALAQQTVVMKTAEIAKRPLEGLDDKLSAATTDADRFYETRLPSAYSDVLAELGVLTNKQGVKLKSVQYGQAPVLDGSAGALTEVRMDAILNGDYRPLVLFMNSLERDRMFFLINGVTLTGQQSGMVGLRLKLTTYLHAAKANVDQTKSAEDVPTSSSSKKKSEARR
jgi:hypothetical protein